MLLVIVRSKSRKEKYQPKDPLQFGFPGALTSVNTALNYSFMNDPTIRSCVV